MMTEQEHNNVQWKKVKLGDCLSIGNGCDYKHLKEGDIPVFGTGGIMTYVDNYLYDGETVCIGRKGTINHPMYHIGKIWTVDTLFYTHSFVDVIPKFIYYAFCNIDWNKYNEATGVPSLSKETIYKIEIPVPDLSAQCRIAAILSSADKVIAATQKTIAKYKQIKRGMMEDLLKPKDGWKMVKLGEVGTFKNGINKDKSQFGFGTKYVSISDAYLEEINYKTLNRLNATDKEIEEYSLFTGDIVFVRSSVKPSGVGYTTLFGDYDKEPVLFSGFMIRYRLNDNINYCPSFMNYLLRDERFRLQVISKSTVSANTNINQESLKELSCSIPNIAEQRRIAAILSGIDATIAAEEKVLQKYEKVKKGLMERLLEEDAQRI